MPADKKLAAARVRALFEWGETECFQGEEMNLTGMPVGGICLHCRAERVVLEIPGEECP